MSTGHCNITLSKQKPALLDQQVIRFEDFTASWTKVAKCLFILTPSKYKTWVAKHNDTELRWKVWRLLTVNSDCSMFIKFFSPLPPGSRCSSTAEVEMWLCSRCVSSFNHHYAHCWEHFIEKNPDIVFSHSCGCLFLFFQGQLMAVTGSIGSGKVQYGCTNFPSRILTVVVNGLPVLTLLETVCTQCSTSPVAESTMPQLGDFFYDITWHSITPSSIGCNLLADLKFCIRREYGQL